MNALFEQNRLTYIPAGHRGAAVLRLSLRSFPYLADHGFQDLTVLPGAFFLELACCLHLDCLHTALGTIQRVEFHHPVILSEEESAVHVEIERSGAHVVRYTFREPGRPPCATLEIENTEAHPPGEPGVASLREATDLRAEDLVDPAAFYLRLRENGNDYGPRFRGLVGLANREGRALGRVEVPAATRETGLHHLPPVLLDSALQLLAAFFLERKRTFVLQGVGELRVRRMGPAGPMWVYAQLREDASAGPDGAVADLDVCDDSGECWWEFRGVRAALLDPGSPRGSSGPEPVEIVVAATFTAEPVADTLQFWSDELRIPTRVKFAPYNQVFQELLDPGSSFHRNRGGCNAILLNLADWATDRLEPPPWPSGKNIPPDWTDLPRRTLPNGLEVAHLNGHETDYLYREIFRDRCYLRHGIELNGAATVIDVGANIGLFSLWVRGECPAAEVYAFEPSPVAFRALRANCEAYGPGLHPCNAGVSDRRGRAELTAYTQSSVFSSFHPDPREDRRALHAVAANLVRAERRDDSDGTDQEVAGLLRDRWDFQTFECPLLSLSDIVREHGLARVDLLKIDAEKCELEILRGIEDGHWPLIRQVVVEVHDRSRRLLGEVQALLAGRGFRCAVEEETLLAGSGLFNVYAVRRDGGSPDRDREDRGEALARDLATKVEAFARALEAFSPGAGAATVVGLCPWAADPARKPGFGRGVAAAEERLLERLRLLPQVHAIPSREILARYPAAEFHAAPGDGGHVPYTPEAFAAIGTSLFRAFAALRRPPFKLIALDCDHTLWRGACGEEGPRGVDLTPAHRHLQEFMVRQREAGLILGLCSRNLESDVWSAFAQNPGWALARGHFSSVRINGAPKSENLRSLADEFKVGLDSVILLDDNPAECAEVRANCPGALVLQLPADPSDWRLYLDHVWPFDHPRLTAEDRRRTDMLREGGERERYRGQVASLKDFIAGLGLEVEVFEPGPEQWGRISQLTLRTNQFNFTTIRRSESEIRCFLEAAGGRGLAVKVRDRFGDYGLVGLLLFESAGEHCRVDTFLLSCRVLGRGVEHRVLAELGRRAVREGRKWIELSYRRTDRNRPAGDFLRTLSAAMGPVGRATSGEFSAAALAELRYEPPAAATGPDPGADRPNATDGPGRSTPPETWERIANSRRGTGEILAAVEAGRRRRAGFEAAPAEAGRPATLGEKLLHLWRRVLGNPRIGMNDPFFEVGGTSLQAVQIAAAIRREMGLAVSSVTFFECPTVRLLCAKLQAGGEAAASGDEARERGARRNRQLKKRTA